MKTITRLKSALPSHGPCIIANLSEPRQFMPRGQRVYLVDPQIPDAPDARILGRTSLGKMLDVHVPWSIIESVRVEIVPAAIASLLFQTSKEEFQKIAAFIREHKVGVRSDWSVKIDD